MTTVKPSFSFRAGRFAWIAGLSLAAIGCTIETPQSRTENAIREGLATYGAVEQVEMTEREDNSFAGMAVVRDAAGIESRLRCETVRGDGEGRQGRWTCTTPLDEEGLQGIENNIRAYWTQRGGNVLDVDMQRGEDNDNMTGYAVVQAPNGETRRLACTATRAEGVSTDFNWVCPRSGHQVIRRP